ncbi:hypothetical protein [Streptomyces sp. NPDC088766]|uniref:hypothetical protein n=1 Tax=Streptomyces sp. NPDC088766 TaxID=3365893 RepID=UPI003827B561
MNALEVLPVPKAADLPPARVEGKRCVWCGKAAETAIGARLSVIGGELHRWQPIGCRPCIRREAGRVYGIHVRVCARCSHRDYCPEGKALYDLSQPKRQAD